MTEDGSHTLFSERFGEHYHSLHGAIQESRHIFINAGLRECNVKCPSILEVGFGTGLNALLSCIESVENNLTISYSSLELFPLNQMEVTMLNYPDELGYEQEFQDMHKSPWDQLVQITESFRLKKMKADLKTVVLLERFDLIYFDAFSPEVQPNLWTDQVLEKLASYTNSGGILTTYSAKGAVRRALQSVGFHVERIPGPPGKREMLRARLL